MILYIQPSDLDVFQSIYKSSSINFIKALVDDTNVNLAHVKCLRDQLVYCGINDYLHKRKFSEQDRDNKQILKNLSNYINPGCYIKTIF